MHCFANDIKLNVYLGVVIDVVLEDLLIVFVLDVVFDDVPNHVLDNALDNIRCFNLNNVDVNYFFFKCNNMTRQSDLSKKAYVS